MEGTPRTDADGPGNNLGTDGPTERNSPADNRGTPGDGVGTPRGTGELSWTDEISINLTLEVFLGWESARVEEEKSSSSSRRGKVFLGWESLPLRVEEEVAPVFLFESKRRKRMVAWDAAPT